MGGLPFLFTLSSHISFDFFLHVFQETDSSSHLQLPHLAVLLYLRGQESKVTQLHLFMAIFHSWVSQSFFHSWVSQSSRCCFSRICGLFSDSYITNVKFTSFYCFQAFLYAQQLILWQAQCDLYVIPTVHVTQLKRKLHIRAAMAVLACAPAVTAVSGLPAGQSLLWYSFNCQTHLDL